MKLIFDHIKFMEIFFRFAHAINIDFFSDLVEILNSLLNSKKLGYREELHCIQAVFAILKGQGEIMNIDPVRFYSHLYKNLLTIHAGKWFFFYKHLSSRVLGY